MKKTVKENIVSARKATEVDGIIDKYVWEPVAMLFSRMFIKIKFTPNVITVLSLITGVAGGVLFYYRDSVLNLIGIALFFLSAVFDTCDGQVARLTNHRSKLGRVLDGFCDTMVEISFYLSITLRLMGENIPFTDTLWGFWIWPVAVYTGLVCHRSQCYMADYYRNLHLFFLNNKYGSELDRSKHITEDIEKAEGDTLFHRIYLKIYRFYTAQQENKSPKLQVLLDNIEKNGNIIPDSMREEFLAESSKNIEYTSILTYNLRTIALFIAVGTGMHVWFFAFVLTVLEVFRLIMTSHYEKIAEHLNAEYFSDKEAEN